MKFANLRANVAVWPASCAVLRCCWCWLPVPLCWPGAGRACYPSCWRL